MHPVQLDQDSVRDLVKSAGPCITIVLPPFVRGQTVPATTVLKNLIDEAAAALERCNVTKREIAELLDPVKKIAEDPELIQGYRWSRAILRCPEKLHEFYLHGWVEQHVSVARHFDVLPLLPELELPNEFFILKLSKKQVALMRGGFELEPAPLPGRIPDKIDDFLALDVPDHDLENRFAAVAGGSRRIRFGTSSERETQGAHLHDYYRAIDRALADFLNPKRPPLLLNGVEEDAALYRSLSTYSNLHPQTIHGGIPDHEILERAHRALRDAAIDHAAAALADTKEKFAPARFSTDLEAIARFASQGRVGHLYVMAEARDQHDKLNEASVETIGYGGVVSAMPADRMRGAVAAAALRF